MRDDPFELYPSYRPPNFLLPLGNRVDEFYGPVQVFQHFAPHPEWGGWHLYHEGVMRYPFTVDDFRMG